MLDYWPIRTLLLRRREQDSGCSHSANRLEHRSLRRFQRSVDEVVAGETRRLRNIRGGCGTKHGITNAKAMAVGSPISRVLGEFLVDFADMKRRCCHVCGHQLEFDMGVIKHEMECAGLDKVPGPGTDCRRTSTAFRRSHIVEHKCSRCFCHRLWMKTCDKTQIIEVLCVLHRRASFSCVLRSWSLHKR